MYKTFHLIGLALLLCATRLHAQTDPTNYTRADIVPPSPTAANLSKYGNVPVTMYTGMANVSVPIFTVQGNDLSLPISLTYNYNGYKPAEQISWIGLGWSLQAGGVITHNVKGLDDVYNTSDPTTYENSASKYNNVNVGSDNTYLSHIDNRTYDAEPDVYSFNFAGHSGKFARIKNRYVLFPVQKLKIADAGLGTGFVITTEDGTSYTFDEAESTQTRASPISGSIPIFVSGWYLTKITNAAHTESITLTYTDEGTVSQTGAWAQTWIKGTNPFNTGYNPAGVLTTPNQSMPAWVASKRLTSIQSSKYTVTFSPESSARRDVIKHTGSGIYALAGISIATNEGTPVKTFHLDHSYFNNYVVGGVPSSGILKLRSLSETVPGSADSLTHRFNYYGEGGIPQPTSSGQLDHFNYYNGNGSSIMMPNYIYPGGANRTPVFSAAVLGSLKKVTYPTGGSTSFEYELNQTNTGNKLRVWDGAELSIDRPDRDTEDEVTDTVSFHLDRTQNVYLGWERTAKAPVDDDPLGRALDNYHPEVRVYKGSLSGDLVYTGKILLTEENGGRVDSLVNMDSGKYIMQLICDKSENWVSIGASFARTTDIDETVPGAGVRVKTIIDSAVIGPPIIRKYKYEFGGGAIANYDTNSYIERRYENPEQPFVWADYSFFTYSSMQVQAEAPGLPMFYSKVTEDTGSDTTNVSRSVYFFQCLEADNNNLGVETAEELHYKKNSGGYTLLSSKFYDYGVSSDTLMIGIKPHVTMVTVPLPPLPTVNTYDANTYFLYSQWKFLNKVTETIYNNDTLTTQTRNHYNLATRNLVLTQQTNSDGRVSVQKMKYPDDYDSAITGNLVAANVVAPVIEKQVWQKRSATDSVLIGGTVTKYDSLLYKPVKIYALENAAGQASLSNETKNGAGKYNTLLSDNHYKQRVTYTYNTDAKITAQQLTGGISTAYQYGYPAVSGTEAGKNAYPVAECKNATAAEFYTQNFEDGSAGTTGAAHTGVKYYSGSSYTVSWTRPNSRNYIITYWYKSGSTWLYSGEVAYTGSSYTLSGGSAYDDVRIFPADAQMSTYTYLQGVGVSSTIDAKGITTYYTYDAHNRLLAIKDQYGNILKQYDYNYAH